ncbi:exocyst complex component Sec10 [Ramicandelaber brevisporus]|nr:exocyst complex component Sec10 [Ramicandelaber brevisporus]
MHLLQAHFQSTLVPLLAPSHALYRDAVMAKNRAMREIEQKLNALVQQLVESVLAHLATRLGGQRKTDFRPNDSDLEVLGFATPTCLQCRDVLTAVHAAAVRHLDGDNRTLVLTEIGAGFHGMLLEHFRKYPVSTLGGLIVTSDFTTYQKTIERFGIAELDSRFQMLQELGNIFKVPADAVRSILDSGYLAKMDAASLHPYVQMRDDFKTSRLAQQLGIPSSTPW